VTNWRWEDHGKTTEKWNAKFPKDRISLFSEEGHGQYLESPPGSGKRYFIPAIPVLAERIKVTKGMHYGKDVEEVFYINFVIPNGDALIKPLLYIERVGMTLEAKPVVCGASPTQIRTALIMVANLAAS
jgi:hypothetical protein